ncbi:MAG: V-type ATP synthase subunit E [Clostridia bacterium]|nr:V-type ATP synthase subunit E [Clostridia bacterium]
MEVQLRELIEQIKKDGVSAAETEAKAIVDAAKAEAEKIVSDAKVQADKLIADAKAENERMTKSSEEAITQAGRNLLISFRESVSKELKAVTGEKINAVYSSDELGKLIISIVEKWAENPDAEDIAVILNTNDLNKLEDALLASLKEKMLKGITLKSNDNFDGGFRISVNNGSAYYDYSAEAVVDMLSNYLSPKVTQLLKEAE